HQGEWLRYEWIVLGEHPNEQMSGSRYANAGVYMICSLMIDVTDTQHPASSFHYRRRTWTMIEHQCITMNWEAHRGGYHGEFYYDEVSQCQLYCGAYRVEHHISVTGTSHAQQTQGSLSLNIKWVIYVKLHHVGLRVRSSLQCIALKN
ncbi:hypothetical protein HAX54_010967, partial [Datura stramonium]|nr:hypothetical protein [Datura stramonium]